MEPLGELSQLLRRMPRRTVPAAIGDPQTAAAWQSIPTTLLVGLDDNFAKSDLQWATDNLEDVRIIQTNHFIIFRHPEAVLAAIMDALDR
jgi:hypothetical protein